MTQINLLPWREQVRQRKKLEFFVTLGCFAGVALFFVVLIHLSISGMISTENRRVAWLQETLGKKQTTYMELQEQRKKQKAIEAELNFLITLKKKSYMMVQLMNDLVKIVPSTVTVRKIVREGNKTVFFGKAESELQVTLFMKNITRMPGFNQPVLTNISIPPEASRNERFFTIEITEKNKVDT